jgi:hypothetical protein
MTDADIAWAAGLFEGEGYITMFRMKAHVLHSIRLGIQMTDRDVLEKFCEIVECGKVGGPHRYSRPHHKPTYVWGIGNRTDVERILLAFLPWLGERRSAKAREMLAEIAKLNMTCEECGVTFRSHRISSRFCSVKCRNRWNYLNRRPAERPSNKGRPRTI